MAYRKDAYRQLLAFTTNWEKRQNCIVGQAIWLSFVDADFHRSPNWASYNTETQMQSGLVIFNSMLVEVLECDSSSLHSSFLLAWGFLVLTPIFYG